MAIPNYRLAIARDTLDPFEFACLMSELEPRPSHHLLDLSLPAPYHKEAQTKYYPIFLSWAKINRNNHPFYWVDKALYNGLDIPDGLLLAIKEKFLRESNNDSDLIIRYPTLAAHCNCCTKNNAQKELAPSDGISNNLKSNNTIIDITIKEIDDKISLTTLGLPQKIKEAICDRGATKRHILWFSMSYEFLSIDNSLGIQQLAKQVSEKFNNWREKFNKSIINELTVERALQGGRTSNLENRPWYSELKKRSQDSIRILEEEWNR